MAFLLDGIPVAKGLCTKTNKKVNMMKNKFTKVAGIAALTLGAAVAQAADTIKVGVLHSLSGTMAI